MSPRRRVSRRTVNGQPIGGGGARHPRALANLKRGDNPAPAGNDRRRLHGAYAAVALERLDAKQQEVFAALAEDTPVRDADGGLPAAHAVPVRLLAETLCRLDDVAAFLRDHGLLALDGRVVEIEGRLRRDALDLAEAMGLTPRAAARLGLDMARSFDLAAHWAAEDPMDGEVVGDG